MFNLTSCGKRPAVFGSPALLQISPSSLSFANTLVGSTSRQSLDVYNSGETAALLSDLPKLSQPWKTLSSLEVSHEINVCSTEIPPHSSCTIVVEFQPVSSGSFEGRFSTPYQSGDQSSSVNFSISGQAIMPPMANLLFDTINSWDFGNLTVGNVATRTVTMTNNGTAPAKILNTSFLSSPFSYPGGSFPGSGGTCGVDVNVGDTCTFQVSFAPGTVGSFSSTVVVQYNNSYQTAMYSLNFLGAGLAASSAFLAFQEGPQSQFGFVVPGNLETKTLTLSNSGGTGATGISATGLSSPFQFVGGAYPGTGGTCGNGLTAGSTCTIVVEFTPLSSGSFSNVMTLNYTNTSGAQTLQIALGGVGSVLSTAHLDFSLASNYDFGSLNAGTSSSITLIVTNSGGVAASPLSASPLTAPFQYTGGSYPGTNATCGTSLDIGASCSVNITFQPSAGGVYSQNFWMQYYDGSSVQQKNLAMTGTGIPGGTRDTTFGTSGLVRIDIAADESVRGLELQTSGKIVVAGDETTGVNTDFSLLRLNTSGTMDATFGTSGHVQTDLGINSTDNVYSSATQADDKIFAVGQSGNKIAAVRYTASGALDSSFNGSGTLLLSINLPCNYETGFRAGITAGGKLVIVGESNINSNNSSFAARFTTGGLLDLLNFGLLGTQSYNFSASHDGLRTFRTDSNGKLITGGYRYVSGVMQAFVTRLTNSGAIDTSYGSSGMFSQDLTGLGAASQITAMVLQSDDKPVFVGTTSNGANTDLMAFRLTTSGVLDTTFGTGGITKIDLAGTNDNPVAVAIDSSNKIVIAGNYTDGADNATAVVRLSSTGGRDSTFGVNGVSKEHLAGQNIWLSDMKLQTDGKILVGGRVQGGSGTDYLLLRYRP